MADKSGQAEIRGIDINKLAVAYLDEALIFKKYCTVNTTSAREIRWYQKTAGFLSATSPAIVANVAQLARPFILEQSVTRNTSYVRKYFVESPWISIEDINDTEVSILATNIRDLVRAVERQVDARIYTVISTGTGVLTGAAIADGWDDTATGNPILDLLTAKQQIRANGYNPEGAVLAINSIEHKNLLNFLISVKGSSIPAFASNKVMDGTVQEVVGLRVVVSENATTDEALVFVPQRACTWMNFMDITSVVVDDPGIGKKIRVWEEGEALLTDPKAAYLITDTVV